VCRGKRSDAEPIQQYFFLLNKRMCKIWPGVSYSDCDIQEIVPSNILLQDEQFCNYIRTSNAKFVASAV